jgi:hypothetical protein
MLSQLFFVKLSRVILTAMEVENKKVFGGINVVVAGDFHQFPPVVGR